MKAIQNKQWTKLAGGTGIAIAAFLATSSFGVVNIELVDVGNKGNADDSTGYGGVAYDYRIGKYEVSNNQYAEFLNKVDPTGVNPALGLGADNKIYTNSMTSSSQGGINLVLGNFDGSKYVVKDGYGNKPVTFVSYFDAMRFVNWLQNGQTSGGTESGVYTIGTGVSETRAVGATFFLPSENEWYKAAYYQPVGSGGPSDSYWQYPMKTDSAPSATTPPGSSTSANYNNAVSSPSLTDVGAYTTASSYYGTFDQGGNLTEWDEAIINIGNSRVSRGGAWSQTDAWYLSSSGRDYASAWYASGGVGFRIAAIPEPTSLMLLALGGLILRRRRS